MKLQRQLLLVSLLLLIVPWAGCQYVREIDGALRYGQEQALEATARAVAAALAAEPLLFGPGSRVAIERTDTPSLYLAALPAAPLVDGYAEEWGEIAPFLIRGGEENSSSAPVTPLPEIGADDEYADSPVEAPAAPPAPAAALPADFAIAWRAAIWRDMVYLLVEVRDGELVYHNPSLAGDNGDRLELRLGNGISYQLGTSAPGVIYARHRSADGGDRNELRISAQWQESEEGYRIEVGVPLALSEGRLGFSLIDAGRDGGQRRIDLTGREPPRLVYPVPSLQERLAVFARPGLRLRAVDRDGWLRGDAGRVDDIESNEGHWLLRQLYRAMLTGGDEVAPEPAGGQLRRTEVVSALNGDTALRWYRQAGRDQRQLLTAATPIVAGNWMLGAVIAEQSSEPFLLRTDDAFARLLFYSTLTLLVTGLGLFGYAGWLSQRVRRLSRVAGEVLDEEGHWRDDFPVSTAGDELGDLSRSYAQLFGRLREYTDYLKTLARKLSHELRTPLAIVHSSLDNLGNETLDDNGRTYLQRAKEGAQRLSHTLTAMSEASRVEESIRSAEPELVHLAPLLREVSRAYADLYRDHRVEFRAEERTAFGARSTPLVQAVPELIVQMLDKLLDNAAGFAPPGGLILLRYRELGDRVVIDVENDGPRLPARMQHQLFDSMVSVREGGDGRMHLGLGLHIVRLIVEFHGGSVRAFDRVGGGGVCFRVVLPLAE